MRMVTIENGLHLILGAGSQLTLSPLHAQTWQPTEVMGILTTLPVVPFCQTGENVYSSSSLCVDQDTEIQRERIVSSSPASKSRIKVDKEELLCPRVLLLHPSETSILPHPSSFLPPSFISPSSLFFLPPSSLPLLPSSPPLLLPAFLPSFFPPSFPSLLFLPASRLPPSFLSRS